MKKKIRILTDVVLGALAATVILGIVKDGTSDLLAALADKPVWKAVFYGLVIWMVYRATTIFFLWEDWFNARVRRDELEKEERERRERDEFFRERNRVN